MKTALIITLTLLAAILAGVAAAQAEPNWITPPGGTVPPEPSPEPGEVNSNPCGMTSEAITPRWFMPIVVTTGG